MVIFDPAGGMLSGTQTLTLSSGSALVFTQTATRLGYTFSGWFDSEADGNKIENGAWVPQSAETTLYAHWTPNRYIVAFEPNGATGEPYTQEFVYGVAQNLVPCKFEKTGYLLATWNTEADGSGKDYGNIANVLNLTSESNGCITLYACGWNLQSYLFTVQNNGPVKSMYLEYGAEYSVTLIEK
ncbi:InlB B-repeat-containing protein [Candidatus Methanomethylophilus sp. 1R26]|uniref:InlB B-repeat-containing protein n=1 Tax=Candidatus Methanomethylophilus sp. 1R26 TaxID=1769296 RepID=UPI001F413141|nr:InlB B-repeat-containing protein [Candidatus Methanomethylophilus sp. 1R26]